VQRSRGDTASAFISTANRLCAAVDGDDVSDGPLAFLRDRAWFYQTRALVRQACGLEALQDVLRRQLEPLDERLHCLLESNEDIFLRMLTEPEQQQLRQYRRQHPPVPITAECADVILPPPVLYRDQEPAEPALLVEPDPLIPVTVRYVNVVSLPSPALYRDQESIQLAPITKYAPTTKERSLLRISTFGDLSRYFGLRRKSARGFAVGTRASSPRPPARYGDANAGVAAVALAPATAAAVTVTATAAPAASANSGAAAAVASSGSSSAAAAAVDLQLSEVYSQCSPALYHDQENFDHVISRVAPSSADPKHLGFSTPRSPVLYRDQGCFESAVHRVAPRPVEPEHLSVSTPRSYVVYRDHGHFESAVHRVVPRSVDPKYSSVSAPCTSIPTGLEAGENAMTATIPKHPGRAQGRRKKAYKRQSAPRSVVPVYSNIPAPRTPVLRRDQEHFERVISHAIPIGPDAGENAMTATIPKYPVRAQGRLKKVHKRRPEMSRAQKTKRNRANKWRKARRAQELRNAGEELQPRVLQPQWQQHPSLAVVSPRSVPAATAADIPQQLYLPQQQNPLQAAVSAVTAAVSAAVVPAATAAAIPQHLYSPQQQSLLQAAVSAVTAAVSAAATAVTAAATACSSTVSAASAAVFAAAAAVSAAAAFAEAAVSTAQHFPPLQQLQPSANALDSSDLAHSFSRLTRPVYPQSTLERFKFLQPSPTH